MVNFLLCVSYPNLKNGVSRGSFAFWAQKPPKRGKGTGVQEVSVRRSPTVKKRWPNDFS